MGKKEVIVGEDIHLGREHLITLSYTQFTSNERFSWLCIYSHSLTSLGLSLTMLVTKNRCLPSFLP